MFKISNKMVRRSGTALAAVLFIMAASSASAKADDHVYTFKIPAENTAKALNDFARQANLQIMFPYDLAAQHKAPAISGQFTRAAVLSRLLDGTGLEIADQTETSVTLRVATPVEAKPSAGNDTDTTEVIVTGTHIRGGNPTSPVHTITQKEIEQSGYSQVGDLMRSLPENFAGGQNPGVLAASSTNSGNSNNTNGSAVNLRGMGSDATLTLLNGHRLSADGTSQASDISGIPLSALQRVEVMPDGASALYGSDAVAGVVNFITRKTYNGVEVSANIGNTSRGGGYSKTYSALGGIAGADWHVLANAEYAQQNQIMAAQRAYSNAIDPFNMLLEPQKRSSLYLNAGRDFSDRLTVSLDVLVSSRSSIYANQYGGISSRVVNTTNTPAYSVAATVDADIGSTWKLHFVGSASGSRNSYSQYQPSNNKTTKGLWRNATRYFEVTADGTLFHLPSGDVKAAVGGGARHEEFTGTSQGAGKRDVSYAYVEALAPLVSPSETRTGLHALELSLSARAENYSDAGSTSNPKIGVRYVPLNGLTLRATAGTSFKAPTMLQLYNESRVYLYPGVIFGQAGKSVLITVGGNPHLRPETSKSWTFGGDFSPTGMKSLKLSATYFNVDYRNRVIVPVYNLVQGLSDPIYATFVEYAPSAARQAEVIAQGDTYLNYAGTYDPANVYAIIQDKNANALAQSFHGVDMSYRQSFQIGNNSLTAFVNGTWTHFDQQTLSTTPVKVLSGTSFNVPKFKGRGGLTYENGGLSASAIVNYVSGETNTEVTPNVPVASWTTIDATAGYRFRQATGVLSGVRIAVAASNLFDQKAPYSKSSGLQYPAAIYYDSTNSSIVGRFVSLSLTKAW